MYCQLAEYPPGLAFMLKPEIGMFASVNDVRPASSPELSSFFFAGLFFPAPSAQRLRPMVHHNLGGWPMVWPYVVVPFPVDTSREGIMWTRSSLGDVDSIVAAWFHLHRSIIESVWLLEGDPVEDFELHSRPWSFASSDLHYADGIISRFRAHLSRQLRTNHRTRLLCSAGDTPDYHVGYRMWCQFNPPTRPVVLAAFFRAQLPNMTNPERAHCHLYVTITTRSNQNVSSTGPADAPIACTSPGESIGSLCEFNWANSYK